MKRINLTILGGCIDGLRFKGIPKNDLFQQQLRGLLLEKYQIDLRPNELEYTNLGRIRHQLAIRHQAEPISVVVFMVRLAVYIRHLKLVTRTQKKTVVPSRHNDVNLMHIEPRRWATRLKRWSIFRKVLPAVHNFLTIYVNAPLGILFRNSRHDTIQYFQEVLLETSEFADALNGRLIVIAPLLSEEKTLRFYAKHFNRQMVAFCLEQNIPIINADDPAFAPGVVKYLADKHHFTPEIHRALADKLAEELKPFLIGATASIK